MKLQNGCKKASRAMQRIQCQRSSFYFCRNSLCVDILVLNKIIKSFENIIINFFLSFISFYFMWLGWGQTEYTFSQNQNIKTLVYRLNLLKIWTLSKLVVLTL